jgi:hypothetical protein
MAGPVTMRLFQSTPIATQQNVIADSTWGDPNSVIVVGAHLDSVPAGPGINDNGSGTAVILETAIHMAKLGAYVPQSGALRLLGRGGARACRLDPVRGTARCEW